MPATQDNENDRIRSLRPRKPREVNLSTECKESRSGTVLQEGAERPARRRRSKLSRCSSKEAEKSEDSKKVDTVTHREGRLGSLAWTDKYKPSRSCPFVGNGPTISELRSWLSQWKNKSLNAERSASRTSLSDSEESTEGLSNCYLLVGPPGVGKTSSVYYLAEELGFKVLEVHASSERPGKRILAQLHEATQSHHVEGSKLLFAASAAQQTACSTKKVEAQKKAKVSGPLQQMFEKAAAKGRAKTVKAAAESNVRKPSKGTLEGYFSARNGVSEAPKVHVASTVTAPAGKTSPKGTLLKYFATPARKSADSTAASAISASKCKEECIPRSAKGGSEKVASSSDSDAEFIGVTSKPAEDRKASGGGKRKQKTFKRMCSRSDDDDDDVIFQVKKSCTEKKVS
ncbi:hypothetical protein V5799_027575 [Amblyomma americanum]|uniref:ATPase AAA-type core domain-containing protein n=1 Tax=Amblyomma americanum TaxID=6943 RepID=A0AAQ4DFC0_AMBAM